MALEESNHNPFETVIQQPEEEQQHQQQQQPSVQQTLSNETGVHEGNGTEQQTATSSSTSSTDTNVPSLSTLSLTPSTPPASESSTTTASSSTTATTSESTSTPVLFQSSSSSSSSSSSAPSTTTASSYEEPQTLTPRSLARKLAAHQASPHFMPSPPSASFPGDDATGTGAASSSSSSSALYPYTTRFHCVLSGHRLKGEGLDQHTRYEITTKFNPTLVEAAAAALAAIKAEKKQAQEGEGEEEEEGAHVDSGHAAAASAPIPTATPVLATSSASAIPAMKIPTISKVHRRYSDFVFLHQLLTHLYPAYLLPPLPPKTFMDRFDDYVISTRRRGLQRFLRELALMPNTVSEDRRILDFLLLPTQSWEATMNALQHTHRMGPSVKSHWIVQSTMSFVNQIMKDPALEDHTHDPHHTVSEESQSFHAQLQKQYEHLHTQVENIAVCEHEFAEAWMGWYEGFEQSDDSVQASRIASTHNTLGLDFAQLLPFTQRIGLILSKHSSMACTRLLDLLQHTSGMMAQIDALFKRRKVIADAVASAKNAVKQAEVAKESMKMKVAMGEKTASDEQQLHSQLAQNDALLRDRQSELQHFHSIAEEEIRKYTTRRRKEIKQVIVEFVKAQIQHENHMKAHWSRMMEQMNKK